MSKHFVICFSDRPLLGAKMINSAALTSPKSRPSRDSLGSLAYPHEDNHWGRAEATPQS
jgi:hypothetical protein